MKEIFSTLKEAGFSSATLAQSAVAGVAVALAAVLGTGMDRGSGFAVAVGGGVIALVVISVFKAGRSFLARAPDAPGDAPKDAPEDAP